MSQTSVGPFLFLFFPALVTCLVGQSSIGQFSGWLLVLLVSSMVGQLSVIGGWCHKYHLVATNMCLSRQNTSFVATKVCLLRQNFCRDKILFVSCQLVSRLFVSFLVGHLS